MISTSRILLACALAATLVIAGCATTPSSTIPPTTPAAKTETPKPVHVPTPPAPSPTPAPAAETPAAPVPAPLPQPAPAPAPAPQAQPQVPTLPAVPTPPVAHTATKLPPNEVPHLKVIMDCGVCEASTTVPALIAEGYAKAAAKSGKTLSTAAEATITITTFTQRPPGARVMFGAFAGKDEIKAMVTYKDKKFEVGDYYQNAVMGMNALSRRIGELVFKKIRE